MIHTIYLTSGQTAEVVADGLAQKEIHISGNWMVFKSNAAWRE